MNAIKKIVGYCLKFPYLLIKIILNCISWQTEFQNVYFCRIHLLKLQNQRILCYRNEFKNFATYKNIVFFKYVKFCGKKYLRQL